MKIFIGADHAGFELKEKIKIWLNKQNIKFEDVGNLVYDKNDDYPDYAFPLAEKVAKEKTKGILLCGSAEGVCIAANKVKGIRAVNPSTVKLTKLSREHNDANVLCLSGWFSDIAVAKKMILTFLNTSLSKEVRHQRRVKKIKKYER